MRFEWDERKRAANIEKHRLDFIWTRQLFDGRARFDFTSARRGETRIVSIGEIEGLVVAAIWTPRGLDTVRIISVRKRVVKKKSNIVSYSDDELAAMQRRGDDKTDRAAVRAKTDKEIAADVADDPEWQDVPTDWVSRARAATGLMRRPNENKRQVTMRFDIDVLEFFRHSGRGWQGRMNAVLRSFMEQQRQRR